MDGENTQTEQDKQVQAAIERKKFDGLPDDVLAIIAKKLVDQHVEDSKKLATETGSGSEKIGLGPKTVFDDIENEALLSKIADQFIKEKNLLYYSGIKNEPLLEKLANKIYDSSSYYFVTKNDDLMKFLNEKIIKEENYKGIAKSSAFLEAFLKSNENMINYPNFQQAILDDMLTTEYSKDVVSANTTMDELISKLATKVVEDNLYNDLKHNALLLEKVAANLIEKKNHRLYNEITSPELIKELAKQLVEKNDLIKKKDHILYNEITSPELIKELAKQLVEKKDHRLYNEITNPALIKELAKQLIGKNVPTLYKQITNPELIEELANKMVSEKRYVGIYNNTVLLEKVSEKLSNQEIPNFDGVGEDVRLLVRIYNKNQNITSNPSFQKEAATCILVSRIKLEVMNLKDILVDNSNLLAQVIDSDVTLKSFLQEKIKEICPEKYKPEELTTADNIVKIINADDKIFEVIKSQLLYATSDLSSYNLKEQFFQNPDLLSKALEKESSRYSENYTNEILQRANNIFNDKSYSNVENDAKLVAAITRKIIELKEYQSIEKNKSLLQEVASQILASNQVEKFSRIDENPELLKELATQIVQSNIKTNDIKDMDSYPEALEKVIAETVVNLENTDKYKNIGLYQEGLQKRIAAQIVNSTNQDKYQDIDSYPEILRTRIVDELISSKNYTDIETSTILLEKAAAKIVKSGSNESLLSGSSELSKHDKLSAEITRQVKLKVDATELIASDKQDKYKEITEQSLLTELAAQIVDSQAYEGIDDNPELLSKIAIKIAYDHQSINFSSISIVDLPQKLRKEIYIHEKAKEIVSENDASRYAAILDDKVRKAVATALIASDKQDKYKNIADSKLLTELAAQIVDSQDYKGIDDNHELLSKIAIKIAYDKQSISIVDLPKKLQKEIYIHVKAKDIVLENSQDRYDSIENDELRKAVATALIASDKRDKYKNITDEKLLTELAAQIVDSKAYKGIDDNPGLMEKVLDKVVGSGDYKNITDEKLTKSLAHAIVHSEHRAKYDKIHINDPILKPLVHEIISSEKYEEIRKIPMVRDEVIDILIKSEELDKYKGIKKGSPLLEPLAKKMIYYRNYKGIGENNDLLDLLAVIIIEDVDYKGIEENNDLLDLVAGKMIESGNYKGIEKNSPLLDKVADLIAAGTKLDKGEIKGEIQKNDKIKRPGEYIKEKLGTNPVIRAARKIGSKLLQNIKSHYGHNQSKNFKNKKDAENNQSRY